VNGYLDFFVFTPLEDHEARLDRGAGMHVAEGNAVGLDLAARGLREGPAGVKHRGQDREREQRHGFLRKKREANTA
jgi:hypothetical protein